MKDFIVAAFVFSFLCFIAFAVMIYSENTMASLWFFEVGAAAFILAIISYCVVSINNRGRHHK